MKPLICFLLAVSFVTAQDLQKLNLPAASSDRFVLPEDRVWPSAHGDADVCVWSGDRLGAMSVTIDDNWVPDHPFWNDMYDMFGFHFTWFVMVDQVSVWALWQLQFNDGHDIQGHDVCAINDYDDTKYESTVARTQEVLNRMVKGNQCYTYAYPCGDAKISISSKYYISCRGVVGGWNPANRIDYMNTRTRPLSAANIDAAISGRHWMNCLYHGVGSNGPAIQAALAHAKSKEADIWMEGFTRVAQYAQSRDTHTLTVTSVAADEITFNLTDQMRDTIFTYPLTVKVRTDSWPGVLATQGGEQREAWIVENGGNKYALVNAVPDGGEVRIVKNATGILPAMNSLPSPTRRTVLYDLQGRIVPDRQPRAGIYITLTPQGPVRTAVIR